MSKENNVKLNLNPENANEREQLVAEMGNLLQSNAWRLVVSIITENIKDIEASILDNMYDKTKLYDEGDRLRDQRLFLKEIIAIPENCIEEFKTIDKEENDIGEDDPYDKTKKP